MSEIIPARHCSGHVSDVKFGLIHHATTEFTCFFFFYEVYHKGNGQVGITPVSQEGIQTDLYPNQALRTAMSPLVFLN